MMTEENSLDLFPVSWFLKEMVQAKSSLQTVEGLGGEEMNTKW